MVLERFTLLVTPGTDRPWVVHYKSLLRVLEVRDGVVRRTHAYTRGDAGGVNIHRGAAGLSLILCERLSG